MKRNDLPDYSDCVSDVTDEDREEIAKLISQGFTSGRLEGQDGHKVSWALEVDSWKD